MHLHRRTINWDVHSESHLSWGTHYQNLSRPDPIMASERYIALGSNTYITYHTYITYQGSAYREFDFLNWISLDLLSALLFLFCSIFPGFSYIFLFPPYWISRDISRYPEAPARYLEYFLKSWWVICYQYYRFLSKIMRTSLMMRKHLLKKCLRLSH